MVKKREIRGQCNLGGNIQINYKYNTDVYFDYFNWSQSIHKHMDHDYFNNYYYFNIIIIILVFVFLVFFARALKWPAEHSSPLGVPLEWIKSSWKMKLNRIVLLWIEIESIQEICIDTQPYLYFVQKRSIVCMQWRCFHTLLPRKLIAAVQLPFCRYSVGIV